MTISRRKKDELEIVYHINTMLCMSMYMTYCNCHWLLWSGLTLQYHNCVASRSPAFQDGVTNIITTFSRRCLQTSACAALICMFMLPVIACSNGVDRC